MRMRRIGWLWEPENSQRSGQQQDEQGPSQSEAKNEAIRAPSRTRGRYACRTPLSEKEVEVAPHKANVQSFREAEKDGLQHRDPLD